MNLNDLFNEEKVRLDPKCWTGKKIGNPKTKVKGGVRVNNCVPAESALNEFAPVSGDDREPDEEEILRQLAAQWWNGTEQQMAKAQNTLAAMGWEIGQDESGDDDAGVFVIRAGDVNGDSYMAFNHSDLDLNEGAELKQAKRKYNQAARDANADQVGAGKKIDTMKNSLRQRDIEKKKDVAEGGAKDRQWSNKDMERLRVATRDFDDIMASDGPEAIKQNLIKKRIQTKPMAGPKGVLPEQGVAEGEQQKGADYRKPKEAEYGPEYDDMVARVKRLAGLGPMKTVYDPKKRQYRNMPTAVQPKK